jgi:hypothetical protein
VTDPANTYLLVLAAILALPGLIIAIAWIFLPFAIYGIKPLLREQNAHLERLLKLSPPPAKKQGEAPIVDGEKLSLSDRVARMPAKAPD